MTAATLAPSGIAAPAQWPAAAGAGQPVRELEPGEMVDEYQITGKLGEGGMGTVYAGVQPVIGKRVAIKVLLLEYASNPNVVNRFVQEARAVNQVQSRYIVDIFSFGRLPDARHYFVMEQLDGPALRDFLYERGTLAFEEAYAILRAVARGLAAAHDKGIVHRDLKPENVIVLRDDEGLSAKLLDFGIAKLIGGEVSDPGFATRTGTAMGTPYYMSPEQVRGVNVDHRTDIYALGVIMFEMCTGSLPFQARSYIDIVNKHLFEAPPDPRQVSKNVPPELAALILRCMQKEAQDRPQSIGEFLAELEALAPRMQGTRFELNPHAEASDEPETVDTRRPSRGATRRLAIAAATIALVGAGVFAAWQVRSPSVARQPRAPVASLSTPVDAGRAAPATGGLIVHTGVTGATYRLGRAIVGSGERLAIQSVAATTHDLVISAPGTKTVRRRILISPGGTLKLNVSLDPQPKPRHHPASAGRPANKRQRPATTQAGASDPDDTLNPF